LLRRNGLTKNADGSGWGQSPWTDPIGIQLSTARTVLSPVRASITQEKQQPFIISEDTHMSRFALLLGAATVALASGSAFAQSKSKFDIVVGGDAYFEAGVVGQDRDSNLRSTDFRNRLRLTVSPTAKADNGLEYGARLRLIQEANNRTTQADRAYMYVNGSFGTISLGSQNGLSDEYAIIAPSDWGTGGVDGSFPAYLGNSSAPGTTGNLRTLISGNSSTRATYLTPKFSGFQFGVTYQPNSDSVNTDINRAKTATPNGNITGAYRDVFEVGGKYEGIVGDVTLGASLYYSGGKAKDSSSTTAVYEDLSSTMAGLSVGYGGLKVAGSYAWSGKSGYVKRSSLATATSREAQHVWTVGAQYTFGATTLGIGYLNSQDAGSLTTAGKSKFDLITLGARYVVAPGLSVGPEFDHFKLSSDVAGSSDKGNIFLARTDLAF
jgi:outer membrane protein OmpU